MSSYSCIAQWGDTNSEVYTVSFSADETSCYSINSDGKVCTGITLTTSSSSNVSLTANVGDSGYMIYWCD